MSHSSVNPRVGQSESDDPDGGQTRKNPETTTDSHATKIKDEPSLTADETADERIVSWYTKVAEKVAKPAGHDEMAEDGARNDSSLSEDWKITALHELVERTDDEDDGLHELERQLDQWNDILDVRSPENQETALHMAIRKGFNKMARQLLTAGAKVDIENHNKESPLHLACTYGDQKLVEVLLEKGSDPEHKDASDIYPLHLAIIRGFGDSVVRKLLGPKGFVINKTVGGAHWTPLNKAIYHECEDVIDVLLEGGASLLIRDSDGCTPLMTAIKGRQYNTFHKLLQHLQKNSTDRNVVNVPDNLGVTPLMRLCSSFKESISHIQHLLQMKPDVNVADEDGQTALHYVMGPFWYYRYTETEARLYGDVALKLIKSTSINRLLHLDKYGGTAFDIAFDKDEKGPNPAFNPLLDSLVDRLVGGESIEESLCWAVYRLERHPIALHIFQRFFAADIREDPKREPWAIVEWAIYARMPRVLLTYLGTLGMKKRVSGDDKIDESISNGWELLETLKKEERPYSAPLAEEKRRKGERDPWSGDDSGKDAQVLRDMEDILNCLYLDKVEKSIGPLDLSNPEGNMASSLNHFRAAIIRSNFVKFQTLQEVLYGDNSVKRMQYIVERLKQFQYAPKVSSEQAWTTSEGLRDNTKARAQFTWIHLPSTNMVWMEDMAKKILKEEGCDRDEAEKVVSFLCSSWTEIPDRTSTSRFMMPRYVFKEAVDLTKHDAYDENVSEWGSCQTGARSWDNEQRETPDQTVQTEAEKGKFFAVSAIYMPYLYFSTYHQSESGERMTEDQMAGMENPSDDEKEIQAEISTRQELFNAYENLVIHQSTTLDEFYYQFGSDKNSVEDRNSRNKNQVVTKYLQDGDIEKQRFWPLLRVGQLWVWTIDEKWLITSTSCATNDIRANLVTDIIGHLRGQIENGSLQIGPTNATEMSRIIVNYCIGAYDRNRGPRHRKGRSIHQIFSDSINEIRRKEPSMFRMSYGRHNHADHTSKMTDIQVALNAVADQLYYIRDVRDELNILMSIARFQRKVQAAMAGSGASEDLSSDHILQDIEALANAALTLQESDIASFQAQIANWQASESVKQGKEAFKQGKIVLIFTLVTVWFLPLSFLTSLFALDVESFMEAPAWAFCVIFLVPLIFLGSAAVYVWKAEIRGYLEYLGILAKKTGEKVELEEGTSTARSIPIKGMLRRRKGFDVEHG